MGTLPHLFGGRVANFSGPVAKLSGHVATFSGRVAKFGGRVKQHCRHRICIWGYRLGASESMDRLGFAAASTAYGQLWTLKSIASKTNVEHIVGRFALQGWGAQED